MSVITDKEIFELMYRSMWAVEEGLCDAMFGTCMNVFMDKTTGDVKKFYNFIKNKYPYFLNEANMINKTNRYRFDHLNLFQYMDLIDASDFGGVFLVAKYLISEMSDLVLENNQALLDELNKMRKKRKQSKDSVLRKYNSIEEKVNNAGKNFDEEEYFEDEYFDDDYFDEENNFDNDEKDNKKNYVIKEEYKGNTRIFNIIIDEKINEQILSKDKNVDFDKDKFYNEIFEQTLDRLPIRLMTETLKDKIIKQCATKFNIQSYSDSFSVIEARQFIQRYIHMYMLYENEIIGIYGDFKNRKIDINDLDFLKGIVKDFELDYSAIRNENNYDCLSKYIKHFLSIILQINENQIATTKSELFGNNENVVCFYGIMDGWYTNVYFPKLKYVFGHIYLCELQDASGFKSLKKVYGTLDLRSITSAEGLENLEIVSNDANFEKLENARALKSLKKIGRIANFSSLNTMTDLENVDIGYLICNNNEIESEDKAKNLKK